MKNFPKRTISEITTEFLARANVDIEHVRKSRDEESCWVVHMVATTAVNEGWGWPAIGRYLNRDHSSIYYTLKKEQT